MSESLSLYGIKTEIWNKVIATLNANTKIRQILLYGSRAKGNFKPGSDIDLCLKGDDLSSNDVRKALVELDKLNLPWGIDLVNYESISNNDLLDHIDRVAIALSKQD